MRTLESGPLRACLELTVHMEGSSTTLKQHIMLTSQSPCLIMHTEVDWHRPMAALRVRGRHRLAVSVWELLSLRVCQSG